MYSTKSILTQFFSIRLSPVMMNMSPGTTNPKLSAFIALSSLSMSNPCMKTAMMSMVKQLLIFMITFEKIWLMRMVMMVRLTIIIQTSLNHSSIPSPSTAVLGFNPRISNFLTTQSFLLSSSINRSCVCLQYFIFCQCQTVLFSRAAVISSFSASIFFISESSSSCCVFIRALNTPAECVSSITLPKLLPSPLCSPSASPSICPVYINNMIVKQRIQKADGSIRFRNYLIQDKLGKGGFAECFRVQRMEDKRCFALKIINKKNLQKPKAKQKMLSEINLHKSVKHRNICQLERVFENEENVYMLLQLCSNGNMFQLIKKRKRLTIPEAQYFLYQLVDALCYLHNRQVIHRDIKLGNLLINDKMELKLADFGLATKLEFQGDRKHTVCGTPNYIAPEVILSSLGIGISGHSYEVDIWSTGVIMYLMLIGRAPFETARIEKTYQKISKADFDFPESFTNAAGKDLLRKMLVVDVSKRYTFEQVLAHEFMNPKQGIPRELPQLSLTAAPKFEKYDKLESGEIKESARNFSVNTLRSQVDLSMDDNFDGLPSFKRRQQKSKDIKGLLRTVFSDRSLSRSLQKLANIGRNSSPMGRLQGGHNFSTANMSGTGTKISLTRDRATTQTTNIDQKQQIKAPSSHVYVLAFKKEIVLSYLLSSGYIGTYEQNYKLLYHRGQGLYFEASGEEDLRRLPKEAVSNNQNIQNRKKFLRNYHDTSLQCEPFLNTARVVYLKRTFEIKFEAQDLVLFRFSNGNYQIFQQGLDKTLLIAGSDLILVTIKEGMEVGRHCDTVEDYVCGKNRDLIGLYCKFTKISAEMKRRKKG